MIANTKIKQLQQLASKKGRSMQQQFLIEGEKMVGEALHADSKASVQELFAVESWMSVHEESLNLRDIHHHIVTERELQRISNLTTPNKVVAVCAIPQRDPAIIDLSQGISLVFESIQDPGNLGTIIRTACWFGVSRIICSPDSVESWNPKVVQASMGSIFHIDVFQSELHSLISQKEKPVPIYATLLQGKNIFEVPLSAPAVFLFGNESKGLSSALAHTATEFIHIPRGTNTPGTIDSLNVSQASAVVLSELARKSVL